MSAVRFILPAALLALGLACGPGPDADLDSKVDGARLGTAVNAIIGGAVDVGDPAVVALATPLGDGEYQEFCTGTLIAPQTVLSAGHCVDPSIDVWAVFGTDARHPTKAIKVEKQYAHPSYDPHSLTADISIWKLQAIAAGIAPVQHNTQAMSAADVGQPVRHVGFGVSNPNTGGGSNTKRQVTYDIRAVDQTEFESGASGKQTCFGDSGGPALAALPGQNEETVIGVVSWGDQSCLTEGYDTRVDVYASSFIEPTMAQWELPQCNADGRCRIGCTPEDVDCACVQDGLCNPDCPNLSNDPDCPVDCGANGVCALDTCPKPDPDCAGIGQSCASELVCNPRLCVSDPQHADSYCSKSCAHDADCPSAMECESASGTCRFPQHPEANLGDPCDVDTFCRDGGVCTGTRFSDLRCAVPCDDATACPDSEQLCTESVTGGMFCAIGKSSDNGSAGGSTAGEMILLPRARAEVPAASSCSSTGGSPVWALGFVFVAFALLARRNRRAGALATVAALSLTACGPTASNETGPTPEQLASARWPIVGGTVDNGDPEVFELYIVYNNNTGSGCTGTLIANRTIATAAHCADPAIGNATASTIYVMNKTYDTQATNSDWIKVVDRRIHPNWNPNSVSISNDIALLLLEKAPAAPKKAWNSASLSGFIGKTVRAVGYGITSNSNQDSGTKRQVSLVVDDMDPTHIFVGNNTNKGICHGDSGGPSFYTFPDGIERLVAIHSYDANGNCTYGGDIRTDAYAGFINQWLTDKEGPQCSVDGACKAGCTPIDPDCYCGADGTCDPRCPDLLQDPDCPKDCVTNGICSVEPCPNFDEDCSGLGETCTQVEQCQTRLCVSDAQHDGFYCSRPCSVSPECPNGMECVSGACLYQQLPTAKYDEPCTMGATYCLEDTICTGPTSDATRCAMPCTATADCPQGQFCEFGQGGYQYCFDPESTNTDPNNNPNKAPVYLQRAKIDGVQTASGCAAVGAGPLAMLGLLSLVSLRRRRAV